MDIKGPINPPSEAGHRFILTLIDYAARYAEAVPLRKIYTETVAEALLDIYSRLSVPEEVLSDQGTQFMSDCMKEVCRILGIKQKASTPYHPMSTD
ncbi:Pol polyprotein [Elysia marginata]|uniref:Pol polyprotein n=1 Tax=Elysia marginata TaxID=1093978 RepID=A0AAV4FL34_9GAST|nr:Pol polyprotein [Elysia marginata]